MGRLRAAFAAAVEGRRFHTVTIVGDAGVGKSRLTREFLASVGEDAYIVRGRCLPYGRGITFWPLVEIVRAAADDRRRRPARASAGARSSASSETRKSPSGSNPSRGSSDTAFPLAETFWAVQRLVEILSERRPLVLVIDDIHFAEATLLDLIEHLSEADLAVPALLVCAARHDLLEERASLGRGAARGAHRPRAAGRMTRPGRWWRACSGSPGSRRRSARG